MKKLKEFENDKHLLKNNTMDNLHQEFLDIYNSVETSSIESFIQKLIKLREHSKVHFITEEELMDEFNYPTSKEHKDEHGKVLAELNYFINNASSSFGKKMLKAYYLEKLPDWFDLHLLSMDSDLASHLSKQKAS